FSAVIESGISEFFTVLLIYIYDVYHCYLSENYRQTDKVVSMLFPFAGISGISRIMISQEHYDGKNNPSGDI
ncbi:hypothetical protein, partial [Klebsiella pneumoniae]|uniref:hypothetical protein n=1 Tax=Klebsiella pneumoniae TaxID=573 RepID=UPI001AD89819